MPRLRILWLSHFVPYPPKGGAFQRSFNLMQGVGAVHELHLLALRHKRGTHPTAETDRAAEELGQFCTSVELIDGTSASSPTGLAMRAPRLALGVPLTASVSDLDQMRRALRTLIRSHKFDLIHFDTIGLACYLREVAHIPAVMSHHGAESHMMLRRTKLEPTLAKRMAFKIEGVVLRQYEAKYCPKFQTNIVVSDLDAQLLSTVTPNSSFSVVPNGVDTTYFYKMATSPGHRVVFAGRLDQYSNRDAIIHFSRHTWPIIQQWFPDATLDILGSNPPNEMQMLAREDPSILVHGFVPDVRPYFEAATVAICPNRDGGGTRVKILDNLAMGKPIVSTGIGIEGIEVSPERHVLVADSPSEFASQIARIFRDDALRTQLSTNARMLAEDKYAWNKIVARLLGIYDAATTRRPPYGHFSPEIGQ